LRIDKWLWAARFFKTRALASQACELGRVTRNGQPAKAGREVKAGDILEIRTGTAAFEVEILGLSPMRGPAAVAQTLYRETEAGVELRRQWGERRREEAESGRLRKEGRPSKRDRREWRQWSGRE
jgi:ribosome-associated heat shock protein Hsp15